MGSHEIGSPNGSIGPQEVMDAQPLDTSISGIYAEHRDPAKTFSKVNGCKLSDKYISEVYSRCWTNLTRGAVLTENPNFILNVHIIGEVTADRVSRTRSEQNYSAKNYFETRRENQDFGRQNNSISRPPLDSTSLGTNMTNRTTSPIDLIPVRTKKI